MDSGEQTMKFMILQANLEKDTNLFLTMNPYYIIEYGN
jgi:2',3'-cyclic-nucleotide 2'-phosphodiesterase (5'-nucleotidase family)